MADSVIAELRAIRELLTDMVELQQDLIDALAQGEPIEPGERDQTEEL